MAFFFFIRQHLSQVIQALNEMLHILYFKTWYYLPLFKARMRSFDTFHRKLQQWFIDYVMKMLWKQERELRFSEHQLDHSW